MVFMVIQGSRVIFQGSRSVFMVFHGYRSVFMVFQGSRLVFRGFKLVFHGSRLVSHGSRCVCMVIYGKRSVLWFKVVFSCFFSKALGWFFIVPGPFYGFKRL